MTFEEIVEIDKLDQNGNIVQNNDNLADEVKKWLYHCSKTLDFVYSPDIRLVRSKANVN